MIYSVFWLIFIEYFYSDSFKRVNEYRPSSRLSTHDLAPVDCMGWVFYTWALHMKGLTVVLAGWEKQACAGVGDDLF